MITLAARPSTMGFLNKTWWFFNPTNFGNGHAAARTTLTAKRRRGVSGYCATRRNVPAFVPVATHDSSATGLHFLR